MLKRTLQFLQRPVIHIESAHQGILKKNDHAIIVSDKNILVTAMKHSHTDDQQIVLRVIESLGIETQCSFHIPAFSTDWYATFRPYELKSFLISNGKIQEINGLEEQI